MSPRLITLVVGARPQFIKLAPLLGALSDRVETAVIHTGQHYDYEMSDLFFKELGMAAPDENLGVGSGPHGQQTGRMLELIEKSLLANRPDILVVFGDTNSTLAAALAASKLHIPVAHVEAGLRSFAQMPEETNRVLTDRLSSYLFAPCESACEHLRAEGITEGVHQVGDIMLDNVRQLFEKQELGPPLHSRNYTLATLHRAELTSRPEKLLAILEVLDNCAEPVFLPLHPRTKATLESNGWSDRFSGSLKLIAPLGYREILGAVQGASRVVTDSGGLQKETYFLGKPCLTVRSETEWPETVQAGWNRLVGLDACALKTSLTSFKPEGIPRPPLYGAGDTASKISSILLA